VVSFQYSVFSEGNTEQETRDALPATRNGPQRLLFLGRLHPKKGLIQALRAWGEIRKSEIGNRKSEWQFVIAGVGESEYERQLKQLCRELDLPFADISAEKLASNPSLAAQGGKSIIFTGPAYHSLREDLMNLSSAFILPSLSEGLPMAVLHAWAHGLPVLMTPECNLPEGFAANAAIRIVGRSNDEFEMRNVEFSKSDRLATIERAGKSEIRNRKSEIITSIEGGLRELFEMSDEERRAMGARGRRLVEERFTWPQVAAQMKEVYEWVLGGGSKPECVVS